MNRNEKILLYSSNIWYFGDGMFGPLLAVFTEKIGGSILDIAWAWSIYLITTGVFSIVVGKYSDHHNKAKIMVFGYGLTAILTFCYIFIQNPLQLLILQAGLGLSLALTNPTWYALYTKYSTPTSCGTIWGLAEGEGKIIMGIAFVIGGLIVTKISFNALFITMGCIQVCATVYQAQILKQK